LDETRVNVALVGPSGAGTSSLINALLANLGGSQTCAEAEVSTAAECTQVSTRYDCSTSAGPLAFWDLPGGGTEQHPTETFVTDKHLAAFDALVIVMEGRFTDFHELIFRAALEKFREQKVLAVCAKADALVLQEVRASGIKRKARLHRGLQNPQTPQNLQTPETANQAFEAVVRSVRKSVSQKSGGRIKDVFLVSTWAMMDMADDQERASPPSGPHHERELLACLCDLVAARQEMRRQEREASAQQASLEDALLQARREGPSRASRTLLPEP
jgi:GTP-binding protein EngB required for normal cell division